MKDTLFRIGGWMGIGLLGVFLALQYLTLDTGIIIGGDDGFELSKALILNRHPELAKDIWNDQPWLHTMITALGFKVFGEHAAIPRLFSFLSVCTLLIVVHNLFGPDRSRLRTAMFAAFLFCSEQFTYLSFAAMTEVPTICWATIAAIIGVKWVNHKGAILSGLLFSLALHLKFTAILLLPVLVVTVCVHQKWKVALTHLLQFGAAAIVTFTLVVFVSPKWDLSQMIGSHASANVITWKEGFTATVFHRGYLFSNPGLLLGGFAGILLLARSRNESLTFAATFLGCAVMFAALQRPWWRYYIVHWDIPLAMLAAMSTNVIVLHALQIDSKSPQLTTPFPFELSRSTTALLAATICSLWFGFGVPIMLSQFALLEGTQVVKEDPICVEMRRGMGKYKWCVSLSHEYPFFGGVAIPPELIIISKKRALTTELKTGEQVLWVGKNYDPDLLLLTKARQITNSSLRGWITNQFTLSEQSPSLELWIANKWKSHEVPSTEQRMKEFGL